MADSYKTNPWFLDGAGDKSASLPTYHNGAHVGYHIGKIVWTGITTAGDDLQIKDADGNIKFQAKASIANIEEYKFDPPLEMKGLNVVTMDTGDIFVYTG